MLFQFSNRALVIERAAQKRFIKIIKCVVFVCEVALIEKVNKSVHNLLVIFFVLLFASSRLVSPRLVKLIKSRERNRKIVRRIAILSKYLSI